MPKKGLFWLVRGEDEDFVRLLRQIEVETASGASVAVACHSAGVSDATYYGWRKKFGGMGPSRPSGNNSAQKLSTFGTKVEQTRF